MTLVVARVTPLGVRLVGDMRVTYLGPERDQEARRAGYLDAALKLIVVRPTLCIGYAGDHVHALDAIKLIANSKLDVAHAERILTESHLRHRESDRWVDFLVASLRPSRLVAVKGGAATEDAASWIGDREAFADYQRHFLAGRPGKQPPADMYESANQAEDIAIASRMSDAIRAVVDGPHFGEDGRLLGTPRGGVHASVGEGVISVVPRIEDGLFKYAESLQAIASRLDEPLPPGLGVVPPDWGSAERGAFTVSVVTPTDPGVAAVGLYFLEGRLGLLYARPPRACKIN